MAILTIQMRGIGIVTLGVVVVAFGSGCLLQDRGTSDGSRDVTKADVERWKQELTNWGRWGPDDQIGTLNLITSEKRKQAASLVRDGISVSLARDAETEEAIDNPRPYQVTPLGISADEIRVSYHGFIHSHLDFLNPAVTDNEDLGPRPLHRFALIYLRMPLFDNVDLEALGEVAAFAEAVGVSADRSAAAHTRYLVRPSIRLPPSSGCGREALRHWGECCPDPISVSAHTVGSGLDRSLRHKENTHAPRTARFGETCHQQHRLHARREGGPGATRVAARVREDGEAR